MDHFGTLTPFQSSLSPSPPNGALYLTFRISIVRHVSDIGGWKQDTLVAFGPLNTGSAFWIVLGFFNCIFILAENLHRSY